MRALCDVRVWQKLVATSFGHSTGRFKTTMVGVLTATSCPAQQCGLGAGGLAEGSAGWVRGG